MSNRPDCITASGLARVIACPRSFQLEKLCPESESEFAAEGTRKHAIMAEWNYKVATQESAEFSGEEDLLFCQAMTLQMANDGNCSPERKSTYIEHRFFLGDKLSGQMDFAQVCKNGKALIIDYKFGVGKVESAFENPQLMAYALLIFANFPSVRSCKVCILQPSALGRKITKAIYTADMFSEMRAKAEAIIAKANAKNAPYADSIGNYCQFCRAKAICQRQKQNAIEVVEDTSLANASNFTITAENSVDVYDRLQGLKDRFNQAKKYLDLVQQNLEAFAHENPNCGLEFKSGAKVFKCTDIRAFLGDYMARTGATYEEILPALKIEKKGLDEVAKAKGVKPKNLAEFYNGLAGCEFIQNKDKLVKGKE